MSGGHFGYYQHHITEIADNIELYIDGEELSDRAVDEIINSPYDYDEAEKKYVAEHRHTMPNRYEYSKATIAKMRKGVKILRQAAIYAQRIDWLLSGDDGEESFHERLEEELNKLKNDKNDTTDQV